MTPYEMALAQLHATARHLRLDDGMAEVLGHCKRELTTHFPVKMDNGTTWLEAPPKGAFAITPPLTRTR